MRTGGKARDHAEEFGTIDPDAVTAEQATTRRFMQMVCRLLAYNAELDLARALDTYLGDPDEYRAITRHLLHQPRHISFQPERITVTIRQPDAAAAVQDRKAGVHRGGFGAAGRPGELELDTRSLS
ncbi:MAG: hypothetical protein M0T80_08445 [Actinomycetota bacterium]|nr:hypothetical protein [Actinomycetota bacterium]